MTEIAPLISIVTPSFNQAQFLETTMRSVLDQDYPRLEYIVIDGGSTDGSAELIRAHEAQLAYWTSEADQGQAEAINKGLRRTTGEIVAWINSDDVYLPGAFREAVEAFAAHPNAGMVYGDGVMVDSNLAILDRHTYPQLDVIDLLSFEVLLQPAVFMRRSALVDVGFLDASYHLILDHELWVRMASKYPIIHVPEFWALERTHAQAKTIAQAGAFVEEAQRLVSWASSSESLSSTVLENNRRVYAGLEVFAARRLIDQGVYGTAFRRILRGFFHHPGTVIRYWYKVVQAGFSAIGLGFLFELYRRTRRKLVYHGDVIDPSKGIK